MSDDVLTKFVGQMSVADFCARVGCSVEELLENGSGRAVASPEPAPSSPAPPDLTEGLMSLPLKQARAEFERRYMLRMLELCGGNRAKASREAGMCRSATYVILNRPQE